MTNITNLIKAERDQWKSLGQENGAWLFHEFLLRNGQPFRSQPLPSKYRLRIPKACFWNARNLARRSKVLRYCEGFVFSQDVPLLIHHAWCADSKDRVVDPTLQHWETGVSRSGNAQYFGLALPIPLRAGSVLQSDFGYKLDRWLEIDPTFQSVLSPYLFEPDTA